MKNAIFTWIFVLLSVSVFARKGQLKGKVTDISNNEPVAFANVVIYGTNIGASTDLDGNFSFTGLEPGYIKLQVSFIGYETKISQDVLINNSSVPFVEIQMSPTDEVLDEVVVQVDFFEKRSDAPIAMQSIGLKEIESNPGSNRDISRVIQSFPGVGSTPAFRNDVIIRGGGPSENRFFLDGVEIPVLNHFSTQGASGGPVGIINADFIQSVDFYSGSFPAAKYNALSGVFDFKQKNGSMDKTNLQATLGASETAFTIDGPLGENASYIFSVRRSYLQFLFSAIGLPFLPTFNDYQLKYKANIGERDQLTVISIGALDQLTLNTGIENPDESQEYILTQIPINNQWSYVFGVVYKHFVDKGFHTIVWSRNMLNNEFYKYPDNDESKPKSLNYNSTEAENKLRYEFSMQEKSWKFNVSANAEYAKYFNSTQQQIYINNALTNLAYETKFDMYKYGASAQATKSLLDNRLSLSAGLRLDGNNYNSHMANALNQFSPRFTASYSLTDKATVNFGVGRYFQLPAYTSLGYRNNDNVLVNESSAKYIGANHINTGVEYRISKAVVFSLEGFYKDYFQYPIDLQTGASLANQGADYSSVAGAAGLNFEGTGQAYGLEVLNRTNYNGFTLLASYTFVRSLFSDIQDELIPSSWDSRHLLTLTGSQEFKNDWRMGFKWRFVGGLPYTPYDLATSANIQAWNAIGQPYNDFSQLNAERFNAFHQLDIRVDKNFFFDKWSLMLYMDIQNAYNFKNKGKDYIIREKNEDGSYLTANGGTEYVLRPVENLSGTVLPTIGIMVKF